MALPLNLSGLTEAIPKLSIPSPPANVGEPQTSSTGTGGGGLGEIMGLAAGIPGGLPAMTGGAAGPAEAHGGAINNRSPIHIAPVGVNLGAIIAPYNEGSAENGGAGLNVASRFIDAQFGRTETAITAPVSTGGFPWTMVIVCTAGAAAIFLFTKYRRR